MKPIIEIKDLHKTYNSNHVEFEVLKGINLTILEGEFVSIMGPSGSGKSTLLYLMGGLEVPNNGSVSIHGKNIHELSDKSQSALRQEEIGFVFQFYNLVPHLSVIENILLPVLIVGKKRKDYYKMALELLKTVDLQEKAESYPSELSGGQQQRVAIARALINSPKIILADEPIGNLDSVSGTEIMNLFKHINDTFNTCIVQVTHSKESAQYGSRIIRVKDGKLAH